MPANFYHIEAIRNGSEAPPAEGQVVSELRGDALESAVKNFVGNFSQRLKESLKSFPHNRRPIIYVPITSLHKLNAAQIFREALTNIDAEAKAFGYRVTGTSRAGMEGPFASIPVSLAIYSENSDNRALNKTATGVSRDGGDRGSMDGPSSKLVDRIRAVLDRRFGAARLDDDQVVYDLVDEFTDYHAELLSANGSREGPAEAEWERRLELDRQRQKRRRNRESGEQKVSRRSLAGLSPEERIEHVRAQVRERQRARRAALAARANGNVSL